MIKNGRKIVALLMVLAVAMSCVACGGPTTVIPDASEQGQVGGNNGVGGQYDSDELGTVTYPLNTDQTLSIWCPSTTAPIYRTYSNYTESPWHSGLVEKTGVEVVWKHPVAGAEDQQAYQLLLTNEVLPDIISYDIGTGEGQILYDEGVLIDLRPYLAEYAPDYWAYLNEPGCEYRLRSVTTSEGQIYMVRMFKEEEYNATVYGPVVRKDWLDECGLDIPVTIEDWEEMLVAFKNKYGAKFAFPVSRFSATGLASGFGAFGSLSCRNYFEDGMIKCAMVQPEYKEYLGTLARWVEEGLLDVDSLTMTDDGFRTKALNNNTGAAFVVMSLFTNMINDAKAEKSKAEWIAVPFPVVEEGQSACYTSYSGLSGDSGCVITTSCPEEKIVLALQWLNYAYTEEGILYYNFGNEGETYTKAEDGTINFTDTILKDRDGADAACRKYTGFGNVAICGVEMQRFVYAKNNQVVAEGVYTWMDNSDAKSYLVPSYKLTADESARHTDLFLAYATYCNEMIMKVIAGEADISQWDSVIENMYGLGLQDDLDILNAAYQRMLDSEQ